MTINRSWGLRACLGAFIVLMVMYFHQPSGANANSRLLTVFALVEHGTFQADPWADTTIDKAIIDGHVFSDKAPLASLIVVPFYALLRLPGGEQSAGDRLAAFHMAVLLAAAIPYATYGLMLLRRLESMAGRGSLNISILWVALFGTFVMQFSNGYFGHVLAGCLMVVSAELVLGAGQTQPSMSAGRAFLGGLIGGLSVSAEYPLFLTQGILLVVLIIQRRFKSAIHFVAGLCGPAAGLLIYNAVITGDPLRFPYQYVVGFPKMESTLGLGGISVEALWGLTFSLFRGAFVYGPPLIFLLLVGSRSVGPGDRVRSWAVLACCAAQLVFFSSYAYWDGGGSAGPRFLVPAVMLLMYECLPGLFARQPVGDGNRVKFARAGWLVLGSVGILLQGFLAGVDALPPAAYAHPLRDYYWPCLLRGQFNPHALFVELGLPVSFSSILFRTWFLLVLIAGLAFSRAYSRSSAQVDHDPGRAAPAP